MLKQLNTIDWSKLGSKYNSSLSQKDQRGGADHLERQENLQEREKWDPTATQGLLTLKETVNTGNMEKMSERNERMSLQKSASTEPAIGVHTQFLHRGQ